MGRTRYGELGQSEYYLPPTAEEPECNVRLKFLANLSGGWRKFVQIVVWALFAVAVAFQLLMLAYQITVLVKRNSVPSPSTDYFNLYKNTRFEDCMLNPPSRLNCNILERRQLGEPELFNWKASPGGWCDYASCLNGWKVMPSEPRDNVFGLTPLSIWFFLNTTAIQVLKELGNSLTPSKKSKKCTGPDIIDWTLAIYALAMLGYWIVDFSDLVRDRVNSTPVSLVEWLTTWKWAVTVYFHPWSCGRLFNGRKAKRVAFWILNIVTLFQWCATIYALQVHWDFYHISANLTGTGRERYIMKYDCLTSQIESAPGTSACSAEALCAKNGFFNNPDFYDDSVKRYSVPIYTFLIIYGLVIYPLSLLVLGVMAALFRCFPDSTDNLVWKGWLPEKDKTADFIASLQLVLLGIFSIVGLAYGIWVLAVGTIDWNFEQLITGGQGTITWNTNCTAVHVNVSPKWFYLDVNEYGRAERIARMWFNA